MSGCINELSRSIHDLAKELPINNGSFLITGATGLIGSCIIDTLLYANVKGANFKIYAMSRSRKKVMEKSEIKLYLLFRM